MLLSYQCSFLLLLNSSSWFIDFFYRVAISPAAALVTDDTVTSCFVGGGMFAVVGSGTFSVAPLFSGSLAVTGSGSESGNTRRWSCSAWTPTHTDLVNEQLEWGSRLFFFFNTTEANLTFLVLPLFSDASGELGPHRQLFLGGDRDALGVFDVTCAVFRAAVQLVFTAHSLSGTMRTHTHTQTDG